MVVVPSRQPDRSHTSDDSHRHDRGDDEQQAPTAPAT